MLINLHIAPQKLHFKPRGQNQKGEEIVNIGKTRTQAPEPKRGRGRPKGSTKPKTPSIYINTSNINKVDSRDVLIGEIIVGTEYEHPNKPGIKEILNEKELKFLELYLSGNYTKEKAMKASGYVGYHEKYLYHLSGKIIEKYECQAADHRKIFRAMGAGEVAVVEGLLKLARGAKSEMVRLNAWSMIAKCIGLTKEQIEGVGGIMIIFEAADQPAALPGALQPCR